MSAGGGFNLIPRPTILPTVFLLLTVLAFVFIVALGEEWGSVWCSVSSLMCVFYLAEPSLIRWAPVFEDAYLAGGERGNSLRQDLFYPKTSSGGRQGCPSLKGLVFHWSWSRHKYMFSGKDIRPWAPKLDDELDVVGSFDHLDDVQINFTGGSKGLNNRALGDAVSLIHETGLGKSMHI